MTRLLLLLGLIALTLPARAQSYDPYGNPYGGDATRSQAVGVRLHLGVGASVYEGPDILTGPLQNQDNVIATNPSVTAALDFPLGAEEVRGRILGGLLNIGADDDRLDVPFGTNPFLTSEVILAEANLMYYPIPPGRGVLSPYLFTGLGGLFATGDAGPGVSRSILQIPVGVGLEIALTRNLSIYGEAAYRFGLTSPGSRTDASIANATTDDCMDPSCKPCSDPTTTNPVCKPCDDPASTNTDCKPCDDPTTTNPLCPEVGGDGNSTFRTRFNSALFTGGLRLGFSPAPPAYIPPPPPVVVPAPVVVPPPPPPAVCNLVELNPVYFDYGSSTISTRARALLNENVELLLANPECCVFIDGTIDNQEMDRFGMPLGGRRAQAVYDYYLSRGVSASKLQIRNRGEGSPNCDKEDPGIGCERNRRVETIPVDCERFRMMLENPSPY